MSKHNLPQFIANTEYAALKNFPATITVTVNIGAGGTITAANYVTNTVSATPLGITIPKGAPIQTDIAINFNSNLRWQGDLLQFTENFGLANQYEGLIFVSMSAENTITVHTTLYNPNVSSITTNARTIVATVRAFIPPFS